LVPLGIGAVAGTPSKRGGTQIEAQVEQQRQKHQAPAHPFLAYVDSESVQAAIPGLFDASLRLEDSAFHDFVGALCKLSLKLVVSMQSGVDVGADASTGTGEGVLDVEWDNIPNGTTGAASIVTPRTERFSKRRVSEIHSPRMLVRYVHPPLSTPIERKDRTVVR
jgi:hypothetical protein